MEDGLLLEALKKILVHILGQNIENMNMIVNSLKEVLVVKKDESSAAITAAVSPGRMTKLTKPAKVPSWLWDMRMET